ncbi:hypothetical protein HYY75_05605 [bacterium]|nr:hypothetical protein [bacterium]
MGKRNTSLIESLIFCCFVLFSQAVFSDISNVTCSISVPAALEPHYNIGQSIVLASTWKGDTPNFAATFKANGVAIGTFNGSTENANFSVSASTLKEGSNNFSVSVLETSVPNSTPVEGTAAGSLFMDRIAPSVTLTIISGVVVSPVTGSDEVVFQVSSNEALGEAPKITVSPGTWNAPTPVFPEVDPFTNNQYKLKVPPGTTGGAYTIRAVCRDKTEPAASRNEGSGQSAFTVDASADGSPTINSSVPPSPIRTETVTLNGTIQKENGNQKVEVLASGSVVATANVPANSDSWSVSFPIGQGNFKYAARRVDPLGNVSTLGPEVNIVSDRTPPSIPTLNSAKTPVSQSKIKITGAGVNDSPYNSLPIKVKLFKDGNAVGSATANTDGTFSFDDVQLVAGNNLFVAQAADTTNDNSGNSAGNVTNYSNAVMVVLDQTKPTIVSGGIVISAPGTPSAFTSLAITPEEENEKSLAESSEPESALSSTGKFEPPPGSVPIGTRSFHLPMESILDNKKGNLQVWLLYRQAWQSGSSENSIQMERGINGFSVSLPNDQKDSISYRFLLRDRAGNASYFPESGELTRLNKRTSLLRLPLFPESPEISGDADDWPVQIFGIPPAERILSYRKIYVHPMIMPEVRQIIAQSGQQGFIVLRDITSALENPPGFENDLELLKTGSLPQSREDLLVQEIRDGLIPIQLLPDPKTIPSAFNRAKEAIQFRLLHETNR